MDILDDQGRLLNHVELVYAPGERALAAQFFETLGCRVVDNGGAWLAAKIGDESSDLRNNVLYASEVTPEQWRFEQALRRAAGAGELAAAEASYRALLAERPQLAPHFGIRYASPALWEQTIDRLRALGGGALTGRIEVSGVFTPGKSRPGPDDTDVLMQAFVKTDLAATGLLTLGQHIELQTVS